MSILPVHVRSLSRSAISADDGVTGHLVRMAADALNTTGRAPSGLLVVRTDTIDVLRPDPTLLRTMSLSRFMAGLTTTVTAGGPVEAVGVLATGKRQGNGMVFLEWTDGRWWWWRGKVEDAGLQAAERSAVHGDPMPDRLGRWWSLARRSRLRMSMAPTATQARVTS